MTKKITIIGIVPRVMITTLAAAVHAFATNSDAAPGPPQLTSISKKSG